MPKLTKLVLVFVMFLFAAGSVLSTHLPAQAKSQTTCPVLGGNIDKNVYVDYQGKRIYFCCPGCDVEFKKDPEKYMKKLQDAGVTPETAPQGKAGK
jgi:YHS domain-containing protein